MCTLSEARCDSKTGAEPFEAAASAARPPRQSKRQHRGRRSYAARICRVLSWESRLVRGQSVESAIDEDVTVNAVDGVDASPNGAAGDAPSRLAAMRSARESHTEGLESNSCSVLHASVQGFCFKER